MRTLILSLLVPLTLPLMANAQGQDLAAAAQSQVGVTLIYDPSYIGLEFPGGDIPRSRGVCTDVVIRALRDAWKLDLQRIVNADMKASFSAYPKIWGLKTTDRNIDHRRVPNLETLFRRAGAELPRSEDPQAFQPGDIVSFRLKGSGLPHIGVVSDQATRQGKPLLTHNIGWGTRTEDALFDHDLVAHFRLTDPVRAWLAAR